jgi:glycosyltransferase involved in cell wall biosynthesis
MRVSLVICTIGRSSELARLFESLRAQTFRAFEVIVVDQNNDHRVATALAPYQDSFSAQVVHAEKGLSRARNVGLRKASGDIIGFPDDDCWYLADFLEQVVSAFDSRADMDGLNVRCLDESGWPIAVPWAKRAGWITKLGVWFRVSSVGMFFRRPAVERIGAFDEAIGQGAGTPWGSCEDIDYTIRAVAAGLRVWYEPSLHVLHPQPVPVWDASGRAKAAAYARGAGRVLRKHRYPLWFVSLAWLHALARMTTSAMSGQFGKGRSYWGTFVGRIQGWAAGPHDPR